MCYTYSLRAVSECSIKATVSWSLVETRSFVIEFGVGFSPVVIGATDVIGKHGLTSSTLPRTICVVIVDEGRWPGFDGVTFEVQFE